MALSASAALTVSEKDGEFTVLRDGRPFVRKIVLDVGPGSDPDSLLVAPDHGVVPDAALRADRHISYDPASCCKEDALMNIRHNSFIPLSFYSGTALKSCAALP